MLVALFASVDYCMFVCIEVELMFVCARNHGVLVLHSQATHPSIDVVTMEF